MSQQQVLVQNIGGVCVVTFDAASLVDGPTIESVSRQLYELVDSQAQRKLLLDFSRVRFLSSTMLGVLVKLQKKADAIKGRVALLGLQRDLHKVFKITRLETLFSFYDSEQEAMGSFGVFTGP